MRKLRVGIIGAGGGVAAVHFLAYKGLESIDVVAGAELNETAHEDAPLDANDPERDEHDRFAEAPREMWQLRCSPYMDLPLSRASFAVVDLEATFEAYDDAGITGNDVPLRDKRGVAP